MSEENKPRIKVFGSNFLVPFLEACMRCDLHDSIEEEHIRYQRPFNFFRNIKNNDGA